MWILHTKSIYISHRCIEGIVNLSTFCDDTMVIKAILHSIDVTVVYSVNKCIHSYLIPHWPLAS